MKAAIALVVALVVVGCSPPTSSTISAQPDAPVNTRTIQLGFKASANGSELRSGKIALEVGGEAGNIKLPGPDGNAVALKVRAVATESGYALEAAEGNASDCRGEAMGEFRAMSARAQSNSLGSAEQGGVSFEFFADSQVDAMSGSQAGGPTQMMPPECSCGTCPCCVASSACSACCGSYCGTC